MIIGDKWTPIIHILPPNKTVTTIKIRIHDHHQIMVDVVLNDIGTEAEEEEEEDEVDMEEEEEEAVAVLEKTRGSPYMADL